ncbi:hypothetical protein A3Q56_06700 [Intoshia linei]|uniref:Uncharacterized protein n=1 Tax=Intoshia linei TaxID=1819745 RepID=A0A177AUA4_9BILA|nr:hypothetical protein A3Q56_06700 [Intoshia linei]
MSSEEEDFLANQSNTSRSELESKLADLTMHLEDIDTRRRCWHEREGRIRMLSEKEKGELLMRSVDSRSRRRLEGVLGDTGIKENSFKLAKDIYLEGRDSADKLSKGIIKFMTIDFRRSSVLEAFETIKTQLLNSWPNFPGDILEDLCMQQILFGLPRDVAEKVRYTAQDPIKLADRSK